MVSIFSCWGIDCITESKQACWLWRYELADFEAATEYINSEVIVNEVLETWEYI